MPGAVIDTDTDTDSSEDVLKATVARDPKLAKKLKKLERAAPLRNFTKKERAWVLEGTPSYIRHIKSKDSSGKAYANMRAEEFLTKFPDFTCPPASLEAFKEKIQNLLKNDKGELGKRMIKVLPPSEKEGRKPSVTKNAREIMAGDRASEMKRLQEERAKGTGKDPFVFRSTIAKELWNSLTEVEVKDYKRRAQAAIEKADTSAPAEEASGTPSPESPTSSRESPIAEAERIRNLISLQYTAETYLKGLARATGWSFLCEGS